MADNIKFVQMRNPKLQSAIDTSATEAVFTEFVDLAGNPLTQADFGTTGYGTLEPNTAREEAISFTIDSNPSGTATLTIVRGLQGKSPYGTGGTAYAHEAQAELVISNNPDLLNKLTAKDNDEEVSGSWKYPANPTHNQNPVPKKYLEDNAVMKTGDQTVAGVKTFSDNPVVPDATAADEPTSKGQVDTLDAQNVKLTGDQTVAGEKTFSTSPKVPDATAADEPYTKGQHDADASASSAVASPTVRGSAKLRDASATPSDPKVLSDGSAINESERSVDPADDAEKLVQLESDGLLHPVFQSSPYVTTGEDGDLSISSGVTDIDCGGEQLVVKNYKDVAITGSAQLTFSNPHAKGTTIIILCRAFSVTSSASPAIDASKTGAEGGASVTGVGGSVDTSGNDGKKGIGFCFYATDFGEGGDSNLDVNPSSLPTQIDYAESVKSVYAAILNWIMPGAGGGSGGIHTFTASGTYTSGKGGRGGGVFAFIASGDVDIQSPISVAGENGGNGNTGSGEGAAGGGGGGGGGFLFGKCKRLVNNTATHIVDGGDGGDGNSIGPLGSASAQGAAAGASMFNPGQEKQDKSGSSYVGENGGKGGDGRQLITEGADTL